MTAIIETDKLTKSYGDHRGIIEVDLAVEQGEVFGFLGPNGAGKTTTIRLLLDLIRPTRGRASVFGLDTTRDAVAIHRRVGYLPGEFSLYDRLTGGQTLEYFANLRGGVDRSYQRSLVGRFDLDPSRLVLDEPTSGLDPLVQQTFFEVLREAVAEQRTVFLSSHVLSEAEKTCDRVGIIREGRLVRVDRVDALRNLAVHEVELRFTEPVPAAEFERIAGVTKLVVEDHVLRMHISGPIAPVVRAAARFELADFVSREPSLEETFLAEYGSQPVEVAGHDR
jgi:ABC-2 type transport system ATP-binding protein